MLQRWFVEDIGPECANDYENDEKFIEWLKEQKIDENSFTNQNIIDVQRHSIVTEVRHSLEVILKKIMKDFLDDKNENIFRNTPSQCLMPLLTCVETYHWRI